MGDVMGQGHGDVVDTWRPGHTREAAVMAETLRPHAGRP